MKIYLDWVYCEIDRKLEDSDDIRFLLEPELVMAEQFQDQEKYSTNKLYSFHAPEAECNIKVKAHKKYEFGVKVRVATTNRNNFIVGSFAGHGNQHDAIR